MYRIGKIPKVLKISIQTNQANWLFLLAFHIPIPFQTMSHTIKGKRAIIKYSGDNICCVS